MASLNVREAVTASYVFWAGSNINTAGESGFDTFRRPCAQCPQWFSNAGFCTKRKKHFLTAYTYPARQCFFYFPRPQPFPSATVTLWKWTETASGCSEARSKELLNYLTLLKYIRKRSMASFTPLNEPMHVCLPLGASKASHEACFNGGARAPSSGRLK